MITRLTAPFLLSFAACLAQAQPASVPQASRALISRTNAAAHAAVHALELRTHDLSARLKAQATTTPTGLRFLLGDNPRTWVSPAPDLQLPEHLVLLIHGLDEPGAIWNDLAPALASSGYTVVRFDYPNDQHIALSADALTEALRTLHTRGTRHVDLVCHSMGGLVARDALTRPSHDQADLPTAEHLVMIATPHTGSPLAPLQAVSDGREQLVRWAESPDHDWRRLLAFMNDGQGQAGDDLTPGSRFLTDLNARPAPTGVVLTSIAAELVSENETLAPFSDRLGDGVVPLHSATAFTFGETVLVRATHRGVLRSSQTERRVRALAGFPPRTPPAIPIVLDRLSRPHSPG